MGTVVLATQGAGFPVTAPVYNMVPENGHTAEFAFVVIIPQVQTKVDEMLSMVDDGEQSQLDELARDPTALVVDKVDEKSARRLRSENPRRLPRKLLSRSRK